MLHNKQLQQEGIYYRGSDVDDQLLYVMGDMENDTRTHHIHVVKWNGTEWKNYIYFRDYLNSNENAALQYQQLKEELERKYADDRIAYTSGKQDMIDNILNQNCIRVRRFEEKDADNVSKLIVRNFREVNSKDYGIAATEKMAKVYDAKKVLYIASYAHMYVFEWKDKIVGVGAISSFWGSETESIF